MLKKKTVSLDENCQAKVHKTVRSEYAEDCYVVLEHCQVSMTAAREFHEKTVILNS